MYDELFATGMKNKWYRVYVDLFAGAGGAVLKDSGRIVPSSALLSLDIKAPFDRYIFCEADPVRMQALQERVRAVAPQADVHFVTGDSNAVVDQVVPLIPEGALTFCFVDPYGVNIKLETIRRLSAGRNMDFLILLALQMDANRNRALYSSEASSKLDDFLGNTAWRKDWEEASRKGVDFRRFLADQYIRAMMNIGYSATSVEDMYEMRTETNLSIYYLAFFSKHPLGYRFWKQVLKYSDEQTNLFG
jgi:three-Cys-motif partner protein